MAEYEHHFYEPRAHKSFRDMDFSLDSEFLASTSTDGSARIWKLEDGVPRTTLTRNSDEKIELCRFSKDGMKPFLFCAVQKGDKAITAVYDISTWKRIGYKRLMKKPVCIMSISLEGKYIALGSKGGDILCCRSKENGDLPLQQEAASGYIHQHIGILSQSKGSAHNLKGVGSNNHQANSSSRLERLANLHAASGTIFGVRGSILHILREV